MMFNRRPSPYARPSQRSTKEAVEENTLKSGEVRIERKTFLMALKENRLGRFLRITEEVGGHRDTMIVPASGLEAFARLFSEMAKAAADMPTEPASTSDNGAAEKE